MIPTPTTSVLTVSLAIAMIFANLGIGGLLPNRQLEDLGGEKRALLGEDKVSVFLFVDPELQRCQEVLPGLVELRQDLAAKEVHWIAVVSDRVPAEAASSLAASGVDFPVVVDRGDVLYGELGVRLYPTVGVTDGEGRLLAYLPYTRVNYQASVRAHVLHGLGEIDDEQLEAALRPSEVEWDRDDAATQRSLRLIRMLLSSGKADKALTKTREVVEANPESAAAHAMLAEVLVALGDCDAAAASLEQARSLDPNQGAAAEAVASCGS